MNLINILPSTATAEFTLMTPAEIAEFEAWLTERDEEQYAWERAMDYVDSFCA